MVFIESALVSLWDPSYLSAVPPCESLCCCFCCLCLIKQSHPPPQHHHKLLTQCLTNPYAQLWDMAPTQSNEQTKKLKASILD